ncbi:MAG: adenylate/guanylate cyclase domain-containing protein [Candidatus Tectimicrobiota bacterium]|nr:MAG: adenylate/guanylate cyclase domain-containing protein [Candidatus Tectomicrobia bacterium]
MRRWLAALLRPHVVIGGLLTVLALALALAEPLPLRRLELLAADWRFLLRGARPPAPEVVIAAIDEKSIDTLGRWPWPYTVQARLVDRLTAYGAAVIGYDVVFSSSDTSAGVTHLRQLRDWLRAQRQDPELLTVLERRIAEADHDARFAAALRRSGRAVLGYFFHFDPEAVRHLPEAELEEALARIRNSKYDAINRRGGVRLALLPLPTAWAVEANIPVLAEAAWGSGYFTTATDIDGAIRRYPLIVRYRSLVDLPGEQDYLFAPLAIRVLERYFEAQTLFWIGPTGVEEVGLVSRRQQIRIPTDAQGKLLINYYGPARTFPYYSIADILAGAVPPEALRDKIVLIGAAATGLADLRVTPFDSALPGVEVHASVLANLLQRDFLVQPWWEKGYVLGFILLSGVVLILALARWGALWGGAVAFLLAAGSMLLNYALFGAGWWLSLVSPVLGTLLIYGGLALHHYVVEERDKRFLKRTFSTYVSPELIEIMVRNKTEPKLGGEAGVRTAFFTDIASFSSFSEVLSATELVALLNEYLTAMTEVLLAEGGTLDKYEGDAIVAFFGAPLPLEDHATRALRTALGMQQALARLRQKWTAEGDKWPALVKTMRMRIGINSGEMVTGNMGSQMRMNYTMMGDAVNTAARLESAAKQYGIYIHCTTTTLRLAGAERFEWRYIDKLRVVGKAEAVETVEIMGYKGELSDTQQRMRDLYHQGLALYRQQCWDEARALFLESAELEEMFPQRPTNPSLVYAARCEFLKANPPGADWDGAWTLTSK